MNNCSFVGRLTGDPKIEVINLSLGDKEVCNFSIAVYSLSTVKGQDNKTLFFDCKAWGSHAKFLKDNFAKGQNVGVTGELRYDAYEKDGKKNRRYYILANQLSFCESKGSDGGATIEGEEDIINGIPDFND